MEKLKYTIFDALINFYRRRRVNLIVSLSFSLGLILPMLCLGNINIFVENLATMRFKDDANVWVAYFEGGYAAAREMPSLLQEVPFEVSDYAICAYKSGTVEISGMRENVFINYLTEGWTGFENCKIIEGSLDLFSGTNICLVEQSFAEKYGGLHTGDSITLSGVTYTISGIFSSFAYYGKILLPLNAGGQEEESDIMISKLYLRTKGELADGAHIADILKSAGLPVSDVKSGGELYHAQLTEGLYKSIGIFGVGFAAFAFAAINVCLVLAGKFNLDKRAYGIRMALGASYGFVFLNAVIENMLCFCIAYLLDVVMVHILKPTYPEGLTMILNARVYVAAYIFGFVLTLVVTWTVLHKLKKQKLSELFERVS
ncbi:MAG: ABC transporter permease [Butyrivibrio sp.]|nr:ABC transporter permease [Butyrivibrio sp.]